MCAVYASESDCRKVFSFPAVYKAYMACRRRKRNTANALKFEADLLENLSAVGEALIGGGYRPSRSVCFVTGKPKLREIFAADFRDRVVHHLLVPLLESVFEPKFIYDSWACRRGKGIHAAVKRLRFFMNGVTRGGRAPAWFLQLDVRSFFMSIDKTALLEIIGRHIKDGPVLELARTIIKHDCTGEYLYKGDPALLEKVPPHKSLFHVPENRGLPIGNLTSQFFANVYLNELDQYVKHTLKARHYMRYVDDLVILDGNRETLIEYKTSIGEFLSKKLNLELKRECTLKRVGEGADFLGYIVRPDYILVRKRVAGNLKSRLNGFQKGMVVKGVAGGRKYTIIHLRDRIVAGLRQVASSYLGHFKHANAYKLAMGLFEKYSCLNKAFLLDNGSKLVPLYEPPFVPCGMKGQYRWFLKKYGGNCIFFQVGKFFELYGYQADRYAGILDIKTVRETRGMRGGGFPVRMLKSMKRRMLLAGEPYIVVAQQGYYPHGLRKRVITEMLTFEGGQS